MPEKDVTLVTHLGTGTRGGLWKLSPVSESKYLVQPWNPKPTPFRQGGKVQGGKEEKKKQAKFFSWFIVANISDTQFSEAIC